MKEAGRERPGLVNPLARPRSKVRAHIYLPGYKVVGVVHVPPSSRLTDFINAKYTTNPYLAVTEAEVVDTATGKSLVRTDFLTVNIQRALMISQFPAGGGD